MLKNSVNEYVYNNQMTDEFIIHDDNQVSKISIEKRYGEEEKVHIRIYEY
jgi:Holliday junction resolvase RusA-like endonuclease